MSDIAAVVVQPLTELLDSAEGRRHLRLLGQLLGHPRLLASAQAVLRGNGSMARCVDLVIGELHHLPDDLRQERVTLLAAFVMRAYADCSIPPSRRGTRCPARSSRHTLWA